MTRRFATRVLGPLAAFALASLAGYERASAEQRRLASASAALTDRERKSLESAPAFAIANATWALGSEDAVKTMLRFELDRLPENEGTARARAFVRFGMIDANPDGQAAVFFQACASDSSLCERPRLVAAAEREASVRFVDPGRHLPAYLLSGHPTTP